MTPVTLRTLIASHLYASPGRPLDAPWLLEQTDALVDAGVAASVLCCSPFERNTELTEPLGRRAVHVKYRSTSAGLFNGTRAGLLLSARRYSARARAYIGGQRDEIDVLHAHFAYPDGVVIARIGAELGIPVVVTLHGSDVSSTVARTDAFGRSVRRALDRAQRIICVSEDLAERAISAGLPARRIVVIPNGYDDRRFSLPAPGEAPARDAGFLYVGALRLVKRVTELVELYLANPDLHETPLMIVGDGELRPAIERMVTASPAGKRVRLLGTLTRDEVARVMRSAAALVLPSDREGYGVVAAEALACGTPVVASATGGLPQMLADRAAGILVTPGDPSALLEALRAIRVWPHTPSEVAGASGARPWSAIAPEIIGVYNDAIATQRAARA